MQSSLEQEMKAGMGELAKLETVTSEAVITTCDELMQKFKDGKSGEWNPKFSISLWQGRDDELTKKEPEVTVNRDRSEHNCYLY